MAEDLPLIAGFDILPTHSPRANSAPKFAFVLTRGSTIVREFPEISKGDLLRVVRSFRPRYLATDNVFEIVPDSRSLFGLVERIPLETRVVQVTGIPPNQVPLKLLARTHGLNVKGKPTPSESARLAAILAAKGVGYVLDCFGEQTEIRVTRGRKMGRGGQSANRYRRKIHSEIQQVVRHIESVLRSESIEFDLELRESDYGYASARFIASAPVFSINRLVESKRGGDFNVLIRPVRKRVEFLPLERQPVKADLQPRYFIVGVDPGITAGLCFLTLDGAIHDVCSRKGLTRAEIIRTIYERGVPVLLATDKTPAPHLARKLAATLDVQLFVPPREVPVSQKKEISREAATQCGSLNAHERDALAAAIIAYRYFLPKLDQVDQTIQAENLSVDRNQLKALVVRGMQIRDAILSLKRTEVDETSEAEPRQEQAPPQEESLDSLKEKVASLQQQNRMLMEKVEDLEQTVEYLKFRESELVQNLEMIKQKGYWTIKRDRLLAKKNLELESLRSQNEALQREKDHFLAQLELLRGARRLEMKGDMIAIKVIPHFTRESISEYARKYGLRKNDVVLFEDSSGGGPQTASLLIDYGVKAIIVSSPLSHLAEDELIEALIPVINLSDVKVQRIDEFALIGRSQFEKVYHQYAELARERARKKGEDALVRLVERYRHDIER
ncbi:MAG: DUF460 domain-containing protein [Candidatus Thorarchaeota archaeon]